MSVKSTGATAPPSKRPRKSGIWKMRLFILFLAFAAGFYGGISATRRVITSSPAWLQRAFGVTELVKNTSPQPTPPTQITNTTPTPEANPTQTTPPPSNPDPIGFPGKTSSSAPASPTSEQGDTTPPPAPNDKLGQLVSEYNVVLRQAQEHYALFESAKRVTSDTKAKAEEMERAITQQSDAAEKLVASVQRAQVLYDALHSFSDFDKRFQETELALTGTKLPQGLPELSVGNLKFVRPL